MENVFKDFKFNTGWKAPTQISMFGKTFPVVIKVKAYFEEDGTTKEQETAYLNYCKKPEVAWDTAEDLLKEYDPCAEERFTPTMLLIDRDGACALLCNDEEDPDDGVAVCLAPKKQVVSQDDYL